ncbi:hypothetical protein [Aquabacter cavernae]|uniref:hypothetical protein n=1 Tax=Aquabacter cavernae TaxID=2496029 RepID=UPI000F8E5252|nr:hypothetical protein [Aquabacter cavernae]
MHAVVRHLPDFSVKAKKVTDTMFRAVQAEMPAPIGKPAAPEPPKVDVEAITRDAEARGREAGLAAARDVAAREMAEAERGFEERLVAARAQWAEQEAEQLAATLSGALTQMEERLSAAIVPILLPFLRGEVGRRALEELEGLMGPILAREDRPVLKISGPADLLERLKARLGDPAACVFEATGGMDVRVVAGETVLETQIRAWAERLGQNEA